MSVLFTAVLNALRQLSTTTSILSDPSRMPEHATEAVLKTDKSTGSWWLPLRQYVLRPKIDSCSINSPKIDSCSIDSCSVCLNNVRSLLSSNVKDSHSLYEVKWRTVSDILQSIGQLISTCISNISVLRHNTTFACYFVLWCEMALIECDTVLICVRWCEKFLLMFLQIIFWNDVVRAITCKL